MPLDLTLLDRAMDVRSQMPVAKLPYVEVNRRSCEGAIRKSAFTMIERHMNHRSIHSDPGLCYAALQNQSSGLISDQVLKQLADVVMRQKNGEAANQFRLGATADFAGTDIRHQSLLASGFRRTSDLADIAIQSSMENRRNKNNRRVCVMDSKLLEYRHCAKSRVKSTSLSSSATSIYSEEDTYRSSASSSPVPSCASDCPSVVSGSRRSSFSLLEEEDIVPQNNNNANKQEEGIVKIEGDLLLVNLREFKETRGSCGCSGVPCQRSLSDPVPDAKRDANPLRVVPEQCPIVVTSKESQTDEEDEEDEPCAISEFWHLDDDGRRWSRLDSKGSHLNRLPSSPSRQLPHLEETHEEPGDVFTSTEGNDSEIQSVQQKPIIDGAMRHFGSKNPVKSKSNSFLKRVGGDLKKFGSFRRMQRTHSTDGSDSRANKPRLPADHRSKGLRKNGKIVISEPTLQSGHDKIDRLRCVPIEPPAGDIRELQSQHLRGRKNSSHSMVSSSSSSGSGGATSTASTPAGRFRSFTEDPVSRSHSGDLDSISPRLFDRSRVSLDSLAKARAQTFPDAENTFFVMPKDHVRGKFPTAIRELDSSEDQSTPPFPFGDSESAEPQQTTIERKNQRPVSVYDNLPQSALHGSASAQDLINILDPTAPSVDDSGVFIGGSQESLDVGATVPDAAFWSVDDIVEQTQSLQQIVSTWDHEQNDKAKQEQQPDSNSVDLPTSNDVLPSYSSETIPQTEDESAASNGDQRTMLRQARLRWESFHRDHAPGGASQPLQLHNLSVGQLMILRRLSMLKLTALLESYALNTSKGSLSWSVPRFIRRIKVPDYKDKAVFGVPLLQNVKRFGQPLPQCIQHALAYMRRTALDQVGLFRKPGVRSRIHKLRASCEENPLLSNFDECSAYDVADMVKQFFRELPDPLMTMKLSETFIGVFLYVPKELWLQTLQAAVMLLPDETRETLKTLICFLSDVAARSSENHMNETNLATCFAPSLFYQQFGSVKSVSSSSPKVRKQQGGKGSTGMALGRPDMKEMNENAAANNCLAFMIRHVKNLFKISEDAMTQCRMSVMQQSEDVLADEIGLTPAEVGDDGTDYYADFHAYVDRVAAQTMREEQRISQNKGGWQNVPTTQGSDLMFRKMSDGNPLRLWRCQVEVDGADVRQVMDRVLHERHLWDEDLVQWKVLQQPDERTQLFQTVRAEMSPHPSRDYCVLRSWRTDVNSRGAAVIVEASTSQPNLLGDVRGVVLTSRYVIEPTEVPTKCLLTHVCRVDTKGRNPEWYNKAYGHVACQLLLRLRDSIHEMPPKSSPCPTSA